MTEMGNYQPLGPFGEEAPFRTDLAPIPGLSPSRYAVRPTVPGKVIELVNVSGELDTYVESASELKGFLGYLDERYNIPSVELSYVVGACATKKGDDMALYAVRDYLADGVDFDKLVSTPASFEQPLVTGAVQAYDGLSCNLVDCMRDAFEEGGRYEFEVTRLDQFLYSPSAPAGRQAIMADVEPFEVGTFSTPEVRVVEPALMKFEVMELLNGYLYLAEDILELQSLSDTTLASRQKMLDALQTLPAVPHDELDWFNVNDATRRMVICMRENDLEGMKAVKRVIESGEEVAAEAEE